MICACAALAYAEVATMIPASGSAYTYSYVVFGELIAWMIGVALILEYTLVVSAVAVGWSGYAAGFLKSIGLGLPDALIQGPELGGVINVPAIFIIWVVAGLLIAGTRESATLNAILVAIKILALALFIAVALPVFNPEHFHPFMPFGFPRSGPSGSEVGVMAAAAIIFFAFYGFDAIATAAEEAKNPSRDLAIGIVGSMVVCVLIYMAVAAAAIGAVAYTGFANSAEPLALILREIGISRGRRACLAHRQSSPCPRSFSPSSSGRAASSLRSPATACCRLCLHASPGAARRCGSPSSRQSLRRCSRD